MDRLAVPLHAALQILHGRNVTYDNHSRSRSGTNLSSPLQPRGTRQPDHPASGRLQRLRRLRGHLHSRNDAKCSLTHVAHIRRNPSGPARADPYEFAFLLDERCLRSYARCSHTSECASENTVTSALRQDTSSGRRTITSAYGWRHLLNESGKVHCVFILSGYARL